MVEHVDDGALDGQLITGKQYTYSCSLSTLPTSPPGSETSCFFFFYGYKHQTLMKNRKKGKHTVSLVTITKVIPRISVLHTTTINQATKKAPKNLFRVRCRNSLSSQSSNNLVCSVVCGCGDIGEFGCCPS